MVRLRALYRRSLHFRKLWTERIVPNSGSVARDILATERTFLAWARTGLGFVGAGSAMFAAYHRDREDENEIRMDIVWPSSILIGNGAFLLLFATRRYLRVLKAIQADQFPIDTAGTLAAVLITAVGTVSSLGLVVKAELDTSGEHHNRKVNSDKQSQP